MPDSLYSQTTFDDSRDGVASQSVPNLLQQTEDEAAASRQRESEAIASRFEASLQSRSPQRTMSPDWVVSQPKSMIEKLRVTPEEIEEILFHYASTSSLPKTARLADVGDAKVRAVVFSPSVQDHLADLRSAMRMSIIRKIEETQTILLEALQNETKLNDSSLTQISDVLREISEVQSHLVTSLQSPEALLTSVNPTDIYTGDELEYMAFLSRRLRASGGPTGSTLSDGSNGIPPALAHEAPSEFIESDFTDTVFDVSPSEAPPNPTDDSPAPETESPE